MSIRSLLAISCCTAALLAQRPGSFDAPVVAVEAFGRIDELVDLDLDGDLDGAGVWFNHATSSNQPFFLELSMHRNDGSGRFQKSLLHAMSVTSGGQPTHYRSVVGDFDGDGHDDLFSLLDYTLCLSRPGNPVVTTLSYSPALYVSYDATLVAADIDGDGSDEIVAGDTSALRVFRILGGTFSMISGTGSNYIASREMTVAEVTGDSTLEAILNEGPTLGFYRLTTGVLTRIGGLALHPTYYLLGALAVTSGDVDGDGDTDIVLFGTVHHMLVERTGPAQFVVHAPAVGGPATHLYDFDGDGDLDGCCCGGGSGITIPDPNYLLGQFEYAENVDGRTFAPAWRMPSLGPFHLAGCADLDGDGHKDLVGGRCVYFGTGGGRPLAQLANAHRAAVGDLDGDGDPDVIDTTVPWNNRGNGAFATATLDLPPAIGATGWSPPQAGDADGDGDLDLFSVPTGGGAGAAVHLLDNQGGGHFLDRGAVTAAGSAFASAEPLRLVDLDGDGDRDAVAVGSVTSEVWFRQTNGAFTAGPVFAQTRVIGAADFDGDGQTDLLAGTNVTQYAFDLAVLRNQGNGTFAARPSVWMYGLREAGIVDRDGDGDLDVIGWTYNGTGHITVFANDGTGGLTQGIDLAVASIVENGWIRVCDIDGDGLWDVVAGPANYPDVRRQDAIGCWVLRQTAPQQFAARLYHCQPGPLADADGDGDLDVIGAAVAHNLTYSGEGKGEREQFGSAIAGTGGAAPGLGASGPFRAGSTVQVHLRGGVGGGFAVLSAAFATGATPNSPLPGLTNYLASGFVLRLLLLTGTQGAAGQGSADFALPIPPSAAGLGFFLQAYPIEPSTTPLLVTQTGGLRIAIGH